MNKARAATCAHCVHHKSNHAYSPDQPRNSGPGKCSVPSCTCVEFAKPEPHERLPRKVVPS